VTGVGPQLLPATIAGAACAQPRDNRGVLGFLHWHWLGHAALARKAHLNVVQGLHREFLLALRTCVGAHLVDFRVQLPLEPAHRLGIGRARVEEVHLCHGVHHHRQPGLPLAPDEAPTQPRVRTKLETSSCQRCSEHTAPSPPRRGLRTVRSKKDRVPIQGIHSAQTRVRRAELAWQVLALAQAMLCDNRGVEHLRSWWWVCGVEYRRDSLRLTMQLGCVAAAGTACVGCCCRCLRLAPYHRSPESTASGALDQLSRRSAGGLEPRHSHRARRMHDMLCHLRQAKQVHQVAGERHARQLGGERGRRRRGGEKCAQT
jgi:hypothetical protein